MPNGGIEKETFVNADEHTRWALTYDMLRAIHDKLDGQLRVCEPRFQSLEKAKRKQTAYATAGGFGGGIIAFLTQWLLRR